MKNSEDMDVTSRGQKTRGVIPTCSGFSCYPLHARGFISRKLLRWLVPYFLISIFVLNLFFLGRPLYNLTLALQIAFYVLAISGYLWQRKGKPPRILGLPFSFCLVNGAALVGVARFLLGKRSGRWKPVRDSHLNRYRDQSPKDGV